MSNCKSYETDLSSWLDGQLDRPSQVELFDHVVRCESCRGFYLEARALDGLLAAVRSPRQSVAPGREVWERIAWSSRRRSLPAGVWRGAHLLRAAAVLVLAVGLGWLFWRGAETPPPPPAAAEVRLGEKAGRMTEARFLRLTQELLRSDPRYHAAMYDVMQQVLRDTAPSEASSEGRSPLFVPAETGAGESSERSPV